MDSPMTLSHLADPQSSSVRRAGRICFHLAPLIVPVTDCDIDYDPFRYMADNKKKYGWTVCVACFPSYQLTPLMLSSNPDRSLYEYEKTIPTLWKTTKEFIEKHPEHLASPNMRQWLVNDKDEYNRCHFWCVSSLPRPLLNRVLTSSRPHRSNFEIGDLNFFRSKAYLDYFDYLDHAGGFSMERWGDAPVHSIAAALFLKPEEIHWFHECVLRLSPRSGIHRLT